MADCAYQPLVVQCQPSITEVSDLLCQFLVINRRRWRATEFRFCCGEPRNFASRSAEFSKIFRGKLWTLLMSTFGAMHS